MDYIGWNCRDHGLVPPSHGLHFEEQVPPVCFFVPGSFEYLQDVACLNHQFGCIFQFDIGDSYVRFLLFN
jgi:hypothetical protein